MGGEEFLNLGKPNNGGTKLFSVSGHVIVRVTMRFPSAPRLPRCSKCVAACAVAAAEGVIPGGSSAPVMPGE